MAYPRGLSHYNSYLWIFPSRKIEIVSDFSRDWRWPSGGGRGPFYRGTRHPVGPWIRAMLHLDCWFEPTSIHNEDWPLEVVEHRPSKQRPRGGPDRPAYRWRRLAPPKLRSTWYMVVCLGRWIRGPLSWFHHGWSWFAQRISPLSLFPEWILLKTQILQNLWNLSI
jgi:hypothetical protein